MSVDLPGIRKRAVARLNDDSGRPMFHTEADRMASDLLAVLDAHAGAIGTLRLLSDALDPLAAIVDEFVCDLQGGIALVLLPVEERS